MARGSRSATPPKGCAAVFDLKKILDRLHLRAFVKTSGSRGLHVHIPIEPIYSEDDVRAFARALADAMTAEFPHRYLASASESLREGKIFVDYLRNGTGATAVAPYGIRARTGAPVALPIAWAEVRKLRSADAVTLPKALAILKRRRRDPWAGYFEVRQRLPILEPQRERRAA